MRQNKKKKVTLHPILKRFIYGTARKKKRKTGISKEVKWRERDKNGCATTSDDYCKDLNKMWENHNLFYPPIKYPSKSKINIYSSGMWYKSTENINTPCVTNIRSKNNRIPRWHQNSNYRQHNNKVPL